MKTLALEELDGNAAVTIALSEFELTTLVALVEQGQHALECTKDDDLLHLHSHMNKVADEFRLLLGHLELLAAND